MNKVTDCMRSGLLAATAAAALVSGTARAQGANAETGEAAAATAVLNDQIADIVVTAERRETRLQTTPIAVSVISGSSLQDKKITSVSDLTAILPNVNINTNAGMTEIAVRGIGVQSSRPGDDARVAYYSDDVYIPRNFAQSALFDVDRIEVMRGPQGTLFGRNATGGAFSVTSRAPTETASGYLNVTGGNFGLIQTEGAISGPLSDTLGVRVAEQTVDRGGFGKNLYTGNDINDLRTQSLRATALWKPSGTFTAKLIGNYHRQNDASYQQHIFAPVTPGALLLGQVQGGTAIIGNHRDVVSDIDPSNQVETYGATLNLHLVASSAISMEAIFNYQDGHHFINYDTDGTEMFNNSVFLTENSKSLSIEYHINGDYSQFHWTAGLYYFHENEFVENRAVLNKASVGGVYQPVQGVWSFATLRTDAMAAFAQGTYDITSRLSLTLGGRWSTEQRKDLNENRQVDFVRPYPPLLPINNAAGFPRNNVPVSFDSFDPKISMQYKFTPDIFAYASYSTGFKSGGYNYGQVQGPFFPEKIKAYEVGLKTTLLDRHLRVNVSAFQYDYTNIQTSIQFFKPVTSLTVLNGPGARIKGVEAEVTANPVRGLTIDLTGSILDAKYSKDFITGDGSRPSLGLLNLKGNTLPESPKFSVNAGIAYTIPVGDGRVTVRGEFQRIGRVYHTVFNLKRDSQAPYNWVNGFITYDINDNWSVSAFVRNLTDTYVKQAIVIQSGILGGGGGYSLGSIEPPRTFGGTVGFKF